MMDNKKLMIFENPEFGQVRSTLINGEPWFVAADVCKALGLTQISRAMSRLDEDEGGLLKVPHPQNRERMIEVNAVNEPGLYHLILCSSKPEAKVFKRWITHEVIPSIRKHGGYMTDGLLVQVMENPSVIYQLAERMLQERDRANRLERELNAAKPKVQFYDSFVNPGDCTNIRNTALELGGPEREFVRFLLRKRVFYRNPRRILVPYASDESKKMFIVRDFWRNKVLLVQTLFTPYGKSVIRDMLLASGYGVL